MDNFNDFTDISGCSIKDALGGNIMRQTKINRRKIEDRLKKKILYKQKNYTHQTLEFYKNLRIQKIDPISHVEVPENIAFKYPYIWDPYTGETLGEDPYGPLYFNPNFLIKHFYTQRLRKLWVNDTDDKDGYYQGYYDDGVGCGDDFHIVGRGYHPEWYLFRLPIIDLYHTTDHKQQIVTFGPKLTDSEISDIYHKAKQTKEYRTFFGQNLPNLIEMKRLYDIAISKEPPINDVNIIDCDDNRLAELRIIKNREAVELLKQMKG